MRTALFWVITPRVVVISYRRFGTTYQFHHQGTLKMGQIGCLETSLRNYHYSLRKNQEERGSHLLRGGSLKSRKNTSRLILLLSHFYLYILCQNKRLHQGMNLSTPS
jgi:hypothetical protein